MIFKLCISGGEEKRCECVSHCKQTLHIYVEISFSFHTKWNPLRWRTRLLLLLLLRKHLFLSSWKAANRATHCDSHLSPATSSNTSMSSSSSSGMPSTFLILEGINFVRLFCAREQKQKDRLKFIKLAYASAFFLSAWLFNAYRITLLLIATVTFIIWIFSNSNYLFR